MSLKGSTTFPWQCNMLARLCLRNNRGAHSVTRSMGPFVSLWLENQNLLPSDEKTEVPSVGSGWEGQRSLCSAHMLRSVEWGRNIIPANYATIFF